MTKTKIGLIKFTNCLPINYALERENPNNAEFIYGTPAELNVKLAKGEIDVAPISAFEYIRNKANYTLLGNAGISSDGACGSVFLFSRKNFKNLQGCTIALPLDSATSIAMLKIILYKRGMKNINFTEHDYSQSPFELFKVGVDAVLCLGDNALKYNQYPDKYEYVYDLGFLWKEMTGLPAVFGVWTARSKWVNAQEGNFENIIDIINNAIENGLGKYLNEVLNDASESLQLDKELIRDYLTNKIKYDLNEQNIKSLNLLAKLYKEII